MRFARNPNGFSLIELLVVMLVLTVLLAILLPSVSGAREQARMAREMVAVKNLMRAHNFYGDAHHGTLIPGYSYTMSAVDASGSPIGSPQRYRYPWRLAPYFEYSIKDTVLVNHRAAQIKQMIEQGGSIIYEVSIMPSFGINSHYVGGSDAAWRSSVVRRADESMQPSNLIVFGTARSNVSGDVAGYHEIMPPIVNDYIETDSAFLFGFLHPRYGSRVITGQLDSHVELLDQGQLHDMRRWVDAAARENNPNWVP